MNQSHTHIHADLIRKIEAHCEASGESRTSFGLRAMNDPNLVRDLRAGRNLRLKSMAAIESAIPDSSVAPIDGEKEGAAT